MRIRVLVREETENWAPDIVERAGRVFGVYLYNPDAATHCCELTPSYELEFVGSVAENLPDDDSAREKLQDDIMEGDTSCEPISYIHCHSIDAMPEIKRGTLSPGTYPMGHLEGTEWESMEEAREHWQGNPDF